MCSSSIISLKSCARCVNTIDRYLSMGAHLNARDRKAVRKTVSGLMKILHPHGDVTQEELGEILELALEGRRRVKGQLKKGLVRILSDLFRLHAPSQWRGAVCWSPRTRRARSDIGGSLVSGDSLHGCVTSDGTVGLYRLEVSVFERNRGAQNGRWRFWHDEGIGAASF